MFELTPKTESEEGRQNIDNSSTVYTGIERRHYSRRQTERREMIRFEPSKEPRRVLKDRRIYSHWDGRNAF